MGMTIFKRNSERAEMFYRGNLQQNLSVFRLVDMTEGPPLPVRNERARDFSRCALRKHSLLHPLSSFVVLLILLLLPPHTRHTHTPATPMFPSLPLLEVLSAPFKRAQQGLFQGKTKQYGNNVPFSKHKTRRTWLPNVHSKRFLSGALGEYVRVKVTTRALRTINKVRVRPAGQWWYCHARVGS